MEEGNPKASALISLFFAFQFWQVNPPTLSAHCFCTRVALFSLICSHVFRMLFAFFALHSRHPQIPVTPPPRQPRPRATPSPTPPPPTRHTCPPPCRPARPSPSPPAPRPGPYLPTSNTHTPARSRMAQSPHNATVSNHRFLSVSIDLYQRTDRKDNKNQETKREEREREREGEREGVRASFFVAVDQSSHCFALW